MPVYEYFGGSDSYKGPTVLLLYVTYRQTSNISHTLVGNAIVDHSDVVGASPVSAAPTTSFSTWHMASMYWAKTTARRDEKHFIIGIWCVSYISDLTVYVLYGAGVLAGGTGAGHVAMWKFSALARAKCEPEDRWKLQPPSTIQGSISQLAVSVQIKKFRDGCKIN